MRVLAVNQFYHPDVSATSQLLGQLCEDLVAGGDDVTVIAGRGSYQGGGTLPREATHAGVKIIRPWTTSLGKASILHRLADYGTFWAGAVARAAMADRPDVILVLTTPPMIAAGAALVAKTRGVPLVSWVQDVYPEVAVELGVLRPKHPLVPPLAAMAAASHRASRYSVALSEGMADRVEAQGQRRDRIRVVQNWSDGAVIHPVAHDDNPFRAEHDLHGRFVVMYSGNLGAGHDVETLLGAARVLRDRVPKALFLFVGGGARKAEAEQLARDLSNVRFLPYQPFDKLTESLSAADVHLASLQLGLEGLLVPSKLYGVLAAGRPLMYVGPDTCEVSRVIRDHDLGWVGAPGDAHGLATALEAAANDPAATRARGERARALFEDEFDRPHAVARWRSVLVEACR